MATAPTGQKNGRPKQRLYWLVSALILLSLAAISSRLFFFGSTHLAGGDRLWRLKIDITTRAETQATSVAIYPPLETDRLRVIQRSLRHAGFHIRNWGKGGPERRSILAFATGSGQRSLQAEFFIHQLAEPTLPVEFKTTLLSNSQREKYLSDMTSLQLNHPLVTQTLQDLSLKQADRPQLINEIINFVQLFAVSYSKDDLNVPITLANRRATALDRSLVMVALCRAAGIPARLITGLILKEDIDPRLHYWVEIHEQDRWLAYDIPFGYHGGVPDNYLPLRQDSPDIVQVLNGELLQTTYDLEREFNHPYLHQFKTRSLFNILDLNRLSQDARHELAILLLLPLGALITALCRHLAGLRSYGVFTPTLLALAMVYSDKLTTGVIFVVVCSLAIGGRSLFPPTMTRIPRLAIIFTLVAIIMAFSVSVMDYFELGQGGRVILLPLIILTSLVDRLYRAMEEKGMNIAMRRLLWTLLITLLCLPVVQFESLGQWLLQFPEGHFITLALFLLIASYKGKQLVNLPLIKFLAEPNEYKGKNRRKTDFPSTP